MGEWDGYVGEEKMYYAAVVEIHKHYPQDCGNYEKRLPRYFVKERLQQSAYRHTRSEAAQHPENDKLRGDKICRDQGYEKANDVEENSTCYGVVGIACTHSRNGEKHPQKAYMDYLRFGLHRGYGAGDIYVVYEFQVKEQVIQHHQYHCTSTEDIEGGYTLFFYARFRGGGYGRG